MLHGEPIQIIIPLHTPRYFLHQTIYVCVCIYIYIIVEMFDFLLTTSHCASWLHKFVPHIHLKTSKSCAFWMKMCTLTKNVYFERKGAYWPKMCLLNKKNVYWLKRCLLNAKLSIDRKCAYWMKMCLLKSHNHLCINNGSSSFGNFFSTSFLSSFLERQETYGYSSKLLFVSRVFLLNSEKI